MRSAVSGSPCKHTCTDNNDMPVVFERTLSSCCKRPRVVPNSHSRCGRLGHQSREKISVPAEDANLVMCMLTCGLHVPSASLNSVVQTGLSSRIGASMATSDNKHAGFHHGATREAGQYVHLINMSILSTCPHWCTRTREASQYVHKPGKRAAHNLI